jgi:hypothetical protein
MKIKYFIAIAMFAFFFTGSRVLAVAYAPGDAPSMSAPTQFQTPVQPPSEFMSGLEQGSLTSQQQQQLYQMIASSGGQYAMALNPLSGNLRYQLAFPGSGMAFPQNNFIKWFQLMFVITIILVWVFLLLSIAVLFNWIKKHKQR